MSTKSAKNRRAPVVWKTDERNRVAEAAARIWLARGKPHDGLMGAIRAGQSAALPAERRRPDSALRSHNDNAELIHLTKHKSAMLEADLLTSSTFAPSDETTASAESIETAESAETVETLEAVVSVDVPETAPPVAPTTLNMTPEVAQVLATGSTTAYLRAVVREHPGLSSGELAQITGLPLTAVSSRLSTACRAQLPENRLDYVEVMPPKGPRYFRYYTPDMLPAEELARRAEAARLEEEGRREREARRRIAEEEVQRQIEAQQAEAERRAEAEAAEAEAAAPKAEAAEVTHPAEAPAVDAPVEAPTLPAAVPPALEAARDPLEAFLQRASRPRRPRGDFNALVGELARRMAHQLAVAFEEEVLDTICDLVDSLPPAPDAKKLSVPDLVEEARRPKKPKVLVYGCKPDLFARIDLDFAEQLDLRYLDTTVAHSEIDDQIRHVDAVVVFKDFISHAAMVHAKKAERYVIVNGGLSSARNELRRLIGELTELK